MDRKEKQMIIDYTSMAVAFFVVNDMDKVEKIINGIKGYWEGPISNREMSIYEIRNAIYWEIGEKLAESVDNHLGQVNFYKNENKDNQNQNT